MTKYLSGVDRRVVSKYFFRHRSLLEGKDRAV